MNFFSVLLQGIVQGITEFLPVSSSGHLLLAQHILGFQEKNLFFNVMLHFGTLIAVIAVYYKKILILAIAFFEIIKDCLFGNTKSIFEKDKKSVIATFFALIPLILLILRIPFLGISLKNLAEKFSSGDSLLLVGISFLVTSIFLYFGLAKEKTRFLRYNKKIKKIPTGKQFLSIKDAVLIGLTQCLAAMFPGLSRSGTTLAVGIMRGINKQTALDFSFITAIPTILAAVILELKDAEKSTESTNVTLMLAGVSISAIIGFFSIKILKRLLTADKGLIFAAYTFILGILVIIISIIETIQGVNFFTGALIQ